MVPGVSAIKRVDCSGNLFHSNVSNVFMRGFSCCPYYRSVRNSEMSARRELTV